MARFLMRCLFTMFAEDVELLPKDSFRDKLRALRGKPEMAAPVLQSLWETMNTGGTSTVLMAKLLRFNGGLFRDATALPLSEVQLSLLIEAAEADWKQVEPAIFGTLLERALDKKSRHKLGAHYTPRAYVERLVMPTIIEPLRGDWRSVQAAADLLRSQGKEREALREVQDFHRKLCEVTVLDPACGSGNFLYVALELMKRLEGEVVATMEELGETQTTFSLAGHTVDPHQFLGIELNPWAANVAELVLWIGYLQWHYRTHGNAAPSEPILRDFKNIENRDALLTWTDRTLRLDENGKPVTRWDGRTTVPHPVTDKEVPDANARVPTWDYIDPRPASWPEATFIVGNPPFIGKGVTIREALGDGYVEAMHKGYGRLPKGVDLVMYWWEKAALLARRKGGGRRLRRFGLIATNSLRQSYNRRVLLPHLNDEKNPLSLLFAIPDHPWVDSADGANVRISMTVGAPGNRAGRLARVMDEEKEGTESQGRVVNLEAETGKIYANLRIGPNLLDAEPLKSNVGLASMGFAVGARGFIITDRTAKSIPTNEQSLLFPLLTPGEITKTKKNLYVIDGHEVDSEKTLRTRFPTIYQHLRDAVWPLRKENRDEKLRRLWWKFRRSNDDYRGAIGNLGRYIVTLETGKYWPFIFVEAPRKVEHGVIAIGTECAAHLAILSGRVHRVWGLAQDGTLEDRPRYNKTRCFDPFPFPELTSSQRTVLRQLGEELDAHRKNRQAQHPKLTLTQMYNVLEKLREGEGIEGKDKQVYEDGLIGLLKDIHDRIDAAVSEAYGWPVDISENDILTNLVALNRERAEEEARGHVRWLRPDYQNPDGRAAESKTGKLEIAATTKAGKAPWPKSLPDQIAAVREVLEDLGEADAETVARTFLRGRAKSVEPLLETLAGLGMAEMTDEGRYAI